MKKLFFLLIIIFSLFSCTNFNGKFTIIKKNKSKDSFEPPTLDVVSPHGDTLKNVFIAENLFLNSAIGGKVQVYQTIIGEKWARKSPQK